VVAELLGPMLHADDERGLPAAQLAELARDEPADGEEIARGVDLVEAEQVVDQLRRIRRPRARERAAERVEVEAGGDAGRAGVRVAARPAEAADRGVEAVDEDAGRSAEEVVHAAVHAELPGPRLGRLPRQRAG